MYVVRRAFRNYGQMMAPGSVVEPAAIKRFKSRVAEGRIVEVNEHNFDKWEEYFKVRMSTTIQLPEEQETDDQETDDQETGDQETGDQETGVQEPEVKVNPVVTAVVK